MTSELEKAMDVIANASPEEVLRIEMHRAVSEVDFVAEARRKPPEPSFAGGDPRNAHIIEAQLQSVAEQQARNERLAAQRQASREELVKILSAGQAPGAEAAVRATLANGG